MPRDGTNGLARIAVALQLDDGRWVWLLLILLVLGLMLGLGDSGSVLLRYDRAAIAAGGWWRLLTAHIVHLDAHHLVLNGLGLVLMWSLFASDFDVVEWCIIVFAGALGISSGLWWLSPHVAWYVGASGVLHSVMAAGAAKHLIDRFERQAGLRATGRARVPAGGGRRSLVWRAMWFCGRRGARKAPTAARTAIIRHRSVASRGHSTCHSRSFFPAKGRSQSA